MDVNRLVSRPQASTIAVEDLVAGLQKGVYRVPMFQRGPRWQAHHVQALFDSIWKGYPIGSLLLWVREADAEQLQLGKIRIDAEARSDARFVVDGQQRLLALLNVLRHPAPTRSTSDIYALWFDLETETIVPAPDGEVPISWLPLNRVLDAVELGEWMAEYPDRQNYREHFRRALQLGRAIREYQVPAYLVERVSTETLREMFTRMNTSGAEMRESEVFAALNLGKRGEKLIDEVAREIEELRMGEVPEAWLIRCIRAVRGDDLAKTPDQRLEAYSPIQSEAVAAIVSALEFLQVEGQVPHLRLLPYRLPIVMLARFFHLHPRASPRHRMLLRRWLWRGIWNSRHRDTGNPHLRWIKDSITEDERASVKALLDDVGTAKPDPEMIEDLVRDGWSFNSARTRILALVLAAQRPRDIRTGDPLVVTDVLQTAGPAAFPSLLETEGGSPSERVLHPPDEGLILSFSRAPPELLATHLCPPLPPVRAPLFFPDTADAPQLSQAWRAERASLLARAARDWMKTTAEPNAPDHLDWKGRLDALEAEPSGDGEE